MDLVIIYSSMALIASALVISVVLWRREGYRRLLLEPSVRPPAGGLKRLLHDLHLWGQNGDVLLALQKPQHTAGGTA